MPTSRIDVKTPDGAMDVYLHAPAGPGPFPTVIMFFDAFGVRPAMHEMAERLTAKGYLVVLPNLLYRAGAFAPFDAKKVWSDPAERDRLMALLEKVDPPSVVRDTQAILDTLASNPTARVDRVGCFGYCLGGRLAFILAGSLPDRVAAAGSIHGGNIATGEPDSPHLQAGKIRGKLYFAVADNDRSCTLENQAVLKASLDAAKVRYQLEIYPGAQHGFAVTDTPAYDQAAAERHWERLLSLFGETLPAA